MHIADVKVNKPTAEHSAEWSMMLLSGANIAPCSVEFGQLVIAPIPLAGARTAPSTDMYHQNDEELYARDRKQRGFLERPRELDINVADAVNWSSELRIDANI